MSIWEKELFADSGPHTPVRASTLWCARIRWKLVERAVCCGFLGTLVFLVFHLALAIGFGASRVGALITISTRYGESIALTTLGLFALVGFGIMMYATRFLPMCEAKWIMSLTREELRFERRVTAILKQWRVVFCVVVAAGVIWLWVRNDCVPQMLDWAAWIFAMAGVYWIWRGVWGRRGAVLVCAKCEHGLRTWRGAGERCPECHSRWKENLRALIGVRALNGGMIFWGAASVAGALVVEFVEQTVD